jgi:radical SAM protein with 4Fe4S-binding SPASM domain
MSEKTIPPETNLKVNGPTFLSLLNGYRKGLPLNRARKKFIKGICSIAAKYYLKKPDVVELLYIKFPTFKSIVDAAMNELYFRLGFERGYKLTSINIEIDNTCNLICRMCPVNNGMERKKGFMDIHLFKKIIDDNPFLDFVLAFQWGEPLLHKNFFEMIGYANSKGIRTMITTNGTLLDDDMIEKLVKSGLERLTISVDGVGDTHTRIRGYDYYKLKENIIKLKTVRDRFKSKMKIDISMVVFEDTEGEMERYFNEWRGVADRVQVVPRFTSSQRKHRCRELWRGTTVVLWDGRVTICCADYDGRMIIGDVNKEKLINIWNGEKMRSLRRMHVKEEFPGVCRNCGEYKSEKVSQRFN